MSLSRAIEQLVDACLVFGPAIQLENQVGSTPETKSLHKFAANESDRGSEALHRFFGLFVMAIHVHKDVGGTAVGRQFHFADVD